MHDLVRGTGYGRIIGARSCSASNRLNTHSTRRRRSVSGTGEYADACYLARLASANSLVPKSADGRKGGSPSEPQMVRAGRWLNPSISLILNCDPSKNEKARKHVSVMWRSLSEDEMPAHGTRQLPFSEHYGSVADRHGVSRRCIVFLRVKSGRSSCRPTCSQGPMPDAPRS